MTQLFYKLNENAILPKRATAASAGYDLKTIDEGLVYSGKVTKFRTGLRIELPYRTMGLIKPKSGLAAKSGIHVLAGVIDQDYQDELIVLLTSLDVSIVHQFKPGDSIAQLIVVPVDLRGPCHAEKRNGGFGSTGK